MQLHPDKTKLTNFEQGFRFLGQVFAGDLIIPAKKPCRGNPPVVAPSDWGRHGGATDWGRHGGATDWGRHGGATDWGRHGGATPTDDLVFGSIQVTTTVISSCLEAQIPIIFLTQLGEYKGHLWSAEFSDLDGQLAQFDCWQNPDFQLEVSRAIVWGKLMNSKQLLLRLNRKRRLPDVAAAIAGITTDIAALETADNLDSLRGYEGVSAARYFPALGQLITNSGFSFAERNRRPPKDPVNSLLSFGYTLLFNNVLSLILAEGLSPYLGNFHYSDRKEPHLAFDLMEEFRSPIVDSLVLSLINKQMLKPTDFTWPNEEGGIYLADGTRRVFLKGFEERISDLVAHPDLQTKVSYRRAIQLQVQRYKRSLLESVPYEAFLRPV